MQLRELGITDEQLEAIESRRCRLLGRMMRHSSSGSSESKATEEDAFDISGRSALAQALLIPQDKIQLRRRLGKGSYGTVYEGTYNFQKVAVNCFEGIRLPGANRTRNST